jgi:hypothetical protein
MPVSRVFLSVCVCVSCLLLLSCSTTVYKDVYPTLSDGRYDSEFPYRGCSKQLEEITESIKMLSSIAYYRTYTFSLEERVTRTSVTPELLSSHERTAVYGNSTASGTATVISYENHRVALLTCAHIVDFEDTVITFFVGADHRPTTIIRTVAIKEKQSNYVAVFPEGGEVEVLAMNRAVDVAIVGKAFLVDPPMPIRVFQYRFGRARELEWGSFVYLLGYPAGYKMVTKGIVSGPNRDKAGSFLVDAMFSRGFSGGIVLAIRDGIPNFELVGMVKLVSAHSSYILSPSKEYEEMTYDLTLPYDGAMFVERRTEIESGITHAVGAERITEFVDENETALVGRGYNLKHVFHPPSGNP